MMVELERCIAHRRSCQHAAPAVRLATLGLEDLIEPHNSTSLHQPACHLIGIVTAPTRVAAAPQGLPQEDGLVEMRERNRVLLQENARLLEAVDRLKRGAAAAQPSPVRAWRRHRAGSE